MREGPGHLSRRSRCRAEIILRLPRDDREIIYRAVSIEAREIPSRRTEVELSLIDDGIVLVVHAGDVVALRAALNSFLRFIDTSLRSLRVAESLMHGKDHTCNSES